MRSQLLGEIRREAETVVDAVATGSAVSPEDGATEATDTITQVARDHLEFLQAAVELDEPAVLRDHVLWSGGTRASRGGGVQQVVDVLEAVRSELVRRVSPEAAGVVDGVVSWAVAEDPSHRDPVHGGTDPLALACRLYVAAAVTGRRHHALAIVEEVVREVESPVDLYVDVFQNALYDVGRRWQRGGLTIAEEHMATATTQFILGVLSQRAPRRTPHRGAAVVIGVHGDQHAVGVTIIGQVLEDDGWDVRFVGTNVPNDKVLSIVERERPALLGVAVTLVRHVDVARELIAAVRERGEGGPRIVVGGAAFQQDPALWKSVGADGFATDARTAAEVARG